MTDFNHKCPKCGTRDESLVRYIGGMFHELNEKNHELAAANARIAELVAALEACVAQLAIVLPASGLVHDERRALAKATAALAKLREGADIITYCVDECLSGKQRKIAQDYLASLPREE